VRCQEYSPLTRVPRAPTIAGVRASPLLSRLILAGFIWVFLFAAVYLLLESVGLWSRLPGPLTRGIDLATGLVLLGALVAHLLLAMGALPPSPQDSARS
jgi:hypothetical protein